MDKNTELGDLKHYMEKYEDYIKQAEEDMATYKRRTTSTTSYKTSIIDFSEYPMTKKEAANITKDKLNKQSAKEALNIIKEQHPELIEEFAPTYNTRTYKLWDTEIGNAYMEVSKDVLDFLDIVCKVGWVDNDKYYTINNKEWKLDGYED